MVTKAVFLDRDGVINANVDRVGKPVAPMLFADFRILPGVEDAVHALKRAGFLIIIVTNQPDIGTGRTPLAELEAMHSEIRRRMPIDGIRACFHVDTDQCHCRKPKPGMITDAAAELNISLADSYVVGDRWRDIEAGRAAGCRTIFVDWGYKQDETFHPDYTVNSLREAATVVLNIAAETGGARHSQ